VTQAARLRAALPHAAAEPVGATEFAQAMAAFAPWEPLPHLAIAVSGGSDSMALALLAHQWARQRGGHVTALTVDHGLRSEAAAEAAQTASWCAAQGIAHAVLRWEGPHPASGLQEAARRARYRLLESWCARAEVLHLLVAHQREDQAETLLMRALRQSGSDGLAGMASLTEGRAIRVLRPLLGFPRARLEANLRAEGQRWIDDPSNRNPAFLRTSLRAELRALDDPDAVVERLAALATRFGRLRQRAEEARAALLARMIMLHPAGFAVLDTASFLAAPENLALDALAAVLTMVSGGDYPPRRERLERLFGFLPKGLGSGRTLAGCVIRPYRGRLLIAREAAAIAPPVRVGQGAVTRWDGRFDLAFEPGNKAELWLGALGADLGLIRGAIPAAARAVIPAAVRATLPVLRNAKGVVAVPALRYFDPWLWEAGTTRFRMLFRPTRPLTGAGFRIV